MSNKRVLVRVSGRVQGVSYRAYTQKQALSLGLTGWVRNLPDGRVELVAEGPSPQIESLVAWCRKGPLFARVDSLDIQDLATTGEFESFSVRRDSR